MRKSIPFVFAIMALLRSPSGWAAVVTTTADSGPGSLREAISSAAPGDTLTFAVNGTITLTSGELLVTTNLTITGPGPSQLTVERSPAAGTPDFRIFNIRSGIVTCSGLTVNNGRTDSGGGILNQARGDLKLQDMVISGNTATNAGGGIKNVGTLVLDRVIITDNTAGDGSAGKSGFGGGLDNEDFMIINNSRINNNRAVGGANADGIGGGINNNTTALLMNCTIDSNKAEGGPAGGNAAGGGINNSSGTMTNFDCTISGNSASGGPGSAGGGAQGGGVANDRGTLHLENCTVSGNSATGGSGTAGASGPSDGGGVANGCGTLTLETCTVSGNAATPGAGTPGPDTPPSGGVFNGCGTTTLNHSTITTNTAVEGAQQPGSGVFNNLGSSLELKNTIIAGNTVTFDFFSVESDTIASGGFNLIGRTNVLISPGPSDRFNVAAADLKLGPLLDNGGPTLTHALLCGSPALDAGDNTDAPATDQRGMPRIVRGVIDIGAYEDSNTAPTVLCPASTTLTANTSTGLLTTVSAQVADAEGDSLEVILSVGGVPLQTQPVTLSGPSVPANVSFTNFFALGTNSILFRVSDTKQCEATCSNTLVILAPNTAPVAQPDSYSVNEDTILIVPAVSGVLTNDSDADADALTAVLVSGPTNALAFTLNSDGSFSYTPATNYFGPDSFTYRANDGVTNSAVVTVSLNVMPVNDAPVARPDSYNVNEDTILTVPAVSGVLTNDSDADADALTAVLVSGPTNALAFTLNSDGSFSYTPATNYFGPDSFTYRANDGVTNSDVVTVSLNVMPVNDAPVARPDSYSVNEDTILTVPAVNGVLTNDRDADADALTAVLVSGPTNALAFTLNSDGSFSYTPATNYFGPDSFTYRANDGVTNSDVVTVSLNVLPVNDAPVARPDSYSVNEDTILTVPAVNGVLTNDSDADADALTAVLVSGPTNALAFTLNSDGSFSYTPATNYFGPDSFTYRANDGVTNSDVVTVSLNVMPVNDAPVARPDSYSVNEDTILTVPAVNGVLTNDSDADADALTAVLVSGPTNALEFTLNPDGSFSYTPATNYFGPDSFTYRANDGVTNSHVVTVSLNVMPVNDAPVARPDSYSVNEDTILTVPAVSGVLTNDSDAEADALTAVLVSGPMNALAFTLNPDGSFSYTPATNYFGPDSFTYQANDGLTNSAPVTVKLTVTPTGGQGCELYPIALHQQSLMGVQVGAVIHDIYNGVQPGNFGWLTWLGSPNEPTLVKSLTPPGDSSTYSNPNDRNDHVVSVGDWVQGKPGISNSIEARAALDVLKQIEITVPVWDQVRATGNNSLYRVAAFARVRLVSYQLPRQNRISAQFLGLVNCQ